jgi:hypothetical protein
VPEPFTILMLILLGFFLGSVAFWNYIVHFLSTRVIPLLREKLGDGVADPVFNLLRWLDGKVTLTRNAVRAGLDALGGQVRKLVSTFRKTSPTTVERTTETTVAVGGGKGKVIRVVEEDIPIDEVPDVPRGQLIADPNAAVSVDAAHEVIAAAEEKLRRGKDLTLEV